MQEVKEFTVISFNIGKGGRKVLEGTKAAPLQVTAEGLKKNLEKIAELFDKEKADVALLQEVDRLAKRTFNTDVAEEIRSVLSKRTQTDWEKCFLKAIPLPNNGEYGNAVLSSIHPIKTKNWPLEKGSQSKDEEERVAISTKYRLAHEGKVIHLWVINVHLGLTEEDQRYQLRKLKEMIGTLTLHAPIILCGDFNITEDVLKTPQKGISYKELVSILNEGKRIFEDLGPTHAVTFGRRKIDYCFFSNTQNSILEAVRVEVVSGEHCSDHHALKAVFRVNSPASAK